MTFIDNSPPDDRTAEDVVAAGGPFPYPDEVCGDCDTNLTATQGWCRCVEESLARRRSEL